MKAKDIVGLLKQTWTEWQEDKASRLAAALAYYTAFSIAPLLVIVIAIVAFVFGQEAAEGGISQQLKELVGSPGAEAMQAMIKSAQKPTEGTIATIISVVILFFGATGVFSELQDSLNTIWEVAPKPGVKGLVRNRILSFAMVLAIGFLLLVSLLVSAVLAGLSNFLGGLIPGLDFLWPTVNFLISFGVITLLFALMFKFLPDAKIAWGDVWIGAAITALLFTIGKSLIGLYLGNSSVGSTYGAAGSLVVLLLWVNYSAQILFFGAEFTQVYANKYGSRIVPAENAVPLTEEARAQQGIPHTKNIEAAAAQDKSSRMAIVNKPASQQSNVRSKRHPAAVVLGGIIGLYQSFTHLVGAKGRKKNRRK